ncbi:hypothetical protein BASA61_008178 [Batrachochytrium salamandrivorans]|nr:hypothetical protein BASA61_008178 [Batrachochytrium salamandrivorans]
MPRGCPLLPMSSAQSATDSVVFDQPENPSSSLCSGDVGQLMTFPTQTLVQTATTTTTITSSLVMMDTSDGLSDSDASMHSDCYSGSQISDSDYIDEDEYGSDMDDDGIDVDRSESHHRHHHCHHQGVGRAPGRGHSHGQHLSLGHAHNHNANLGSAVRTNGSSSSIAASLTAASSTASDANSSAEGQAALRKRILMIQQDATLSSTDKASKIQDLMSSGWTNRQKLHAGRTSTAPNKLENKLEDFNSIEDADRIPTWHNREANILGCKHYQRAAKLQAHCCGRWFSCRFCHDEVSDHNIVRNLTTTMMCMHCDTVQSAGQTCINELCKKQMSLYYCDECKLWDNDPKKSIYHCTDCGICRIGKGLGQDYFHCKKCNVCMAISLMGRHKCIERNLESDCPICGEYMFTSTTTVIFMCHQEYIQTSYQCPTCFKSLANMSDYFKRVDTMLAQHQMPPEFTNIQSHIYCNDCEKKCNTKFHFLYHKCDSCSGYNTKVLHTFEIKSNGDKALVSSSPALLNTTLPLESPHSAGDLSGASYSNDVVFSGSYASGVPVSRSVRARTQSISAQSLDPHMRRTSASGPSSSSNASGCN